MKNIINSKFTLSKLDPNTFLFSIFVIGLILRIPAFFQEIPPFAFCDEADLYLNEAYRMAKEKDYVPFHLRSGIINFYLPILTYKVIEIFTNQVNLTLFYIINRLLYVGVLNSLIPIVIYHICIKYFDSRNIGYTAAALYALSPMALGVSRIFYPDHYIAIFSSVVLLMVVQWMKNIHKLSVDQKTVFFFMLGTVFAVMLSVKTSSILCVTLLFLIPCRWMIQKNDNAQKYQIIQSDIYGILFAILVGSLIFFIINSFNFNLDLFFEGQRWNYKHYTNGHAGLGSDNGVIQYFEFLFFNSVGIACGFLSIFGIVVSFLRRNILIIVLTACMLIAIIYLGSFSVITNRNLMFLLPFFIIVLSYSLSEFHSKFLVIKSKYFTFIFILVMLFEPLSKTALSFVNDFESDSRIASLNWIDKNIRPEAKIGYASGCWGKPVPKGYEARSVQIFELSSDFHELNDLDYFVMDSWIYQHSGPGTSKFLIPIYSEMFFMNPTLYYPNDYHAHVDEMISRLNLIHAIRSNKYYGPEVYIYKIPNELRVNTP
jgi:4-amino-4-deoxy-L-arabinose transferase-like glycosyltransferase